MFKHPMDGHSLKETILFFIRCLDCSRLWERSRGFSEACRTSLPNFSGSTPPWSDPFHRGGPWIGSQCSWVTREGGGDLELIQTSLLFCVNQFVLMLTRCIYTTNNIQVTIPRSLVIFPAIWTDAPLCITATVL